MNDHAESSHNSMMYNVWNAPRSCVQGLYGAVATDVPMATRAAVRILEDGGTAADAAIAACSCLDVSMPWCVGLGGDVMCLYYNAAKNKVHCLDGSGRSSSNYHIGGLAAYSVPFPIPVLHPANITVPGAPAAYCDLKERFGNPNLGMYELLKPAIEAAETGVVATEYINFVGRAFQVTPAFGSHGELLVDVPRPGKVRQFPELAQAMRELAGSGRDAFYHGRIAKDIVDSVQAAGGLLTLEDLALHKNDWRRPLSTIYRNRDGRDFKVYSTPLNTTGVALLEALNIIETTSTKFDFDSIPIYYHTILEAHARAQIDLSHAWKIINAGESPQIEKLLSKSYAEQMAACINYQTRKKSTIKNTAQQQVQLYHQRRHADGDTSYVSVVDREGNACSINTSIFLGAFVGVKARNWGFYLHNRGCMFSMFMHNKIAPRMKPFHTLAPAMITDARNGALLASLGAMGTTALPQVIQQVFLNMAEFGLSPQQAVDAPRIQVDFEAGSNTKTVVYEAGIDSWVIDKLRRFDHDLGQPVENPLARSNMFRRCNVITKGAWWDKRGKIESNPSVLWAATDPRSDGIAMGIP